MVKDLVDSGASLARPMESGVSIYHLAAANNDVRLLDYAISQNHHLDLEMKTSSGMTPAHHAAMMGNMDAINLLIENGASLNAVNSEGVNVFGQFVKTDNLDLFSMFLKEALQAD